MGDDFSSIGDSMPDLSSFSKRIKLSDKKCKKHDIRLYLFDDRLLECSSCIDARERQEEKQKVITTKLKEFRIDDFDGVTWDTIMQYDENQVIVMKKLNGYANGSIEWKSLILLGRQGTGKSLYAYLIGQDFIRAGKMVIRLKSRDFFNEVERLRKIGMPLADYLKKIKSYDLLVFEEVGRSGGTKHEFDTLFSIMDFMIEKKKKIIFTSNLVFSPPVSKENGAKTREAGEDYFIDFVDEDRVRDQTRWDIIPFSWISYRRIRK